ncbi:hypothetical protein L3X38_017036 [Prunus dulcis]|uniref:Uncharacterized protein n=1 Tax=Prunus dulcis TaxID=3755 RepID=A0AAD4Z9E4_PRUDU|nr:hypothetical protein L3X38_017036 [Prunus dulcis]
MSERRCGGGSETPNSRHSKHTRAAQDPLRIPVSLLPLHDIHDSHNSARGGNITYARGVIIGHNSFIQTPNGEPSVAYPASRHHEHFGILGSLRFLPVTFGNTQNTLHKCNLANTNHSSS